MHSRFRVTNSSDRLGLDVGVPQVRAIIKVFWEFKMSMTNNMALVHRASNAAMVTVKSSQVYRVPPQGNQGERSQQEKKGQEELRSGTARALAVISLNMLLYSPSLQALLGTKASLSETSALS